MKKLYLISFLIFVFGVNLFPQANITIDLKTQYQEIVGIGGFGAKKVWWDTPPFYDQQYIVDIIDDLGLTAIRSVLAEGWETTDDDGVPCTNRNTFTGNAYSLHPSGFNLNGADVTCQSAQGPYTKYLPFYRDLQAYAKLKNVPLKMIITSWSPPHWTKYNGCIFGTGSWNVVDNGMGPEYDYSNPIKEYDSKMSYSYDAKVLYNNDGRVYKYNVQTPSTGHLPTETAYWIVDERRNMYPEVAEYIAGYLKQMESDGIDIYAISFQNEPRFGEPYASAIFSPNQYRDMLTELQKMFKHHNINKVKVFGPEDMGSAGTNAPWVNSILVNSPETRDFIDFWAVHSYLDGINTANGTADGWTSMYNQVHPYNKELWMTETSGESANWNDPSPNCYDVAKNIFMAFKYGKLSGWTYWYMCDNFYTGGVKNKKFYSHKQFARYIRPGAIMVDVNSSDPDVWVAAFSHDAEARLTYVFINNASGQKTASIPQTGLPAKFNVYRTSATDNSTNINSAYSGGVLTMPSKSITTLVFEGTNKAPTMNVIKDTIVIRNTGIKNINLTGITDGDNTTQTVTITAKSSNTSILADPTVTAVSNGKATLSINPQNGIGWDTITVTMKDNGSTDIFNTAYKFFRVKVLAFVNAAPTINPVNDVVTGMNLTGKQTINLSGITDGNDGSQSIVATLTSSNASVTRSLRVAYTSGSTGNISFYNNAIGSSIITLTLKDNGGSDIGGNDTKVITFNLTVKDVVNGDDDVTADYISLFPNPAHEKVIVDVIGEEYKTVDIVDITGRVLLSEEIKDQKIQINTASLPRGLYVVIVRGDNKSIKSKLLIE